MKGSQAGLSQELLCRTCVSCSMSWESSSLIKWRCAGQGHQAAHPAPPAACYLLGSPYPFKNVLSLAADFHWNYVMVDHGWTGPSSCTGDIPGTGLARCDTDHRARAGSPLTLHV